jgi:cytochrome c
MTYHLFFILILIFISNGLSGVWQHPDCREVTDDDFRETVLVGKTTNDPGLLEPIDMDFIMDEEGNVDIYFLERRGKVKFYDSRSEQVSTVGELDIYFENYLGLVGIALDPDFESNRWVYLFYSAADADAFRLSRYAIDMNNELDTESERILLDIPTERTGYYNWHIGGALAFDAYGDLWGGVGDNEEISSGDRVPNADCGSPNTATLIGSIFRIHPDDKAPGGYTIPAGNLGEYWAGEFDAQGRHELAAQYRDPAKVLPEIYSKGHRQPYTLTVDPVRRWATTADCGPDWKLETEEHTLITMPGFYGSPYFFGTENVPHPELGKRLGGGTAEAPENHASCNDGVTFLPPALPATYAYEQRCAMTGPVYRYDGDLNSGVKLPPHFDGVWFMADFNNPTWIKTADVSSDGGSISDVQEAFSGFKFNHILKVKLGPDGALYINNYAGYTTVTNETRILRLEYMGNCLPDYPKREKAGCTNPGYEEYDSSIPVEYHDSSACISPVVSVEAFGSHNRPGEIADIKAHSISILAPGQHEVQISEVNGNLLLSRKGFGSREYDFTDIANSGIGIVTVSTERGSITRKINFWLSSR